MYMVVVSTDPNFFFYGSMCKHMWIQLYGINGFNNCAQDLYCVETYSTSTQSQEDFYSICVPGSVPQPAPGQSLDFSTLICDIPNRPCNQATVAQDCCGLEVCQTTDPVTGHAFPADPGYSGWCFPSFVG